MYNFCFGRFSIQIILKFEFKEHELQTEFWDYKLFGRQPEDEDPTIIFDGRKKKTINLKARLTDHVITSTNNRSQAPVVYWKKMQN